MAKSLLQAIVNSAYYTFEHGQTALDACLTMLTSHLDTKIPQLSLHENVSYKEKILSFPFELDCDIIKDGEFYLIIENNNDHNSGAFGNVHHIVAILIPTPYQSWQIVPHSQAIKTDRILNEWIKQKNTYHYQTPDKSYSLSLIDEMIRLTDTFTFTAPTTTIRPNIVEVINTLRDLIDNLLNYRLRKSFFKHEVKMTKKVTSECRAIGKTASFIMPWYNGIPLCEFINSNQLTTQQIAKIILNISVAVDNLPANLCHGDLWSGNILIDPQTLDITIIDFALATDEVNTVSGFNSIQCTAPEQYNTTPYIKTEKTEVWAQGLVLASLLNATHRTWLFKIDEQTTHDIIDDKENAIPLNHNNVAKVSYELNQLLITIIKDLSDLRTLYQTNVDKNTAIALEEGKSKPSILLLLRKKVNAFERLSCIYNSFFVKVAPTPVGAGAQNQLVYESTLSGTFRKNVRVRLSNKTLKDYGDEKVTEEEDQRVEISGIYLTNFMHGIDGPGAEQLQELCLKMLAIDPVNRLSQKELIVEAEKTFLFCCNMDNYIYGNNKASIR